MDDYDSDAQWRAHYERGMANLTTQATLYGQIMWNGKPVIDDDDGGTAGVREPRRPRPPAPLSGGAMATPEFAFA